MSANVLPFNAETQTAPPVPDDTEPTLDPEPVLDPEPDIDPDVATGATALVPAVMQVLPADFPLPALIRFVPDGRLRRSADEAAAYALSIKVVGPDGLSSADLACTALRTSLKAIEDHFAEPCEIANKLHKSLTGARADWLARGTAALKQVGGAMATEQLRLRRIADEERRKAQEEADRQMRELARKHAAEAEKAKAPAPVVEELKRQAETCTAPPVIAPTIAPTLAGSSVVTTWKARIAGTPACDDPNPATADFTPGQKLEALKLMKAILDGKAPLTGIEINWKYWNSRAKADKSTLAIPGIEAFEEVGTRAKGSRAR